MVELMVSLFWCDVYDNCLYFFYLKTLKIAAKLQDQDHKTMRLEHNTMGP